MIIGKEQVLKDLDDMVSYFERCAESAAHGSKAREQFARWAANLTVVSTEIVLRDIGEEDDGK